MSPRWDSYFMRRAKLCASMSKDPSTKVGAVIVRPDRTECSSGWNGFARSLPDDAELYANRAFKIASILHAETNAILSSRDQSLDGYTIYISGLLPCAHCASQIIQSGIKAVVVESLEVPDRWRENMDWALRNLRHAHVQVRECKGWD